MCTCLIPHLCGLPLQGDYYRYLSELEPEETAAESDVVKKAAAAYELAQNAADGMKCTNPIRLGLALNVSGACWTLWWSGWLLVLLVCVHVVCVTCVCE